MRVLAACSLGGAGHLTPLLPLLTAARHRGDQTCVIGPPALRDMVERSGFPFRAGDEPPEDDIAPIRERLPAGLGPLPRNVHVEAWIDQAPTAGDILDQGWLSTT